MEAEHAAVRKPAVRNAAGVRRMPAAAFRRRNARVDFRLSIMPPCIVRFCKLSHYQPYGKARQPLFLAGRAKKRASPGRHARANATKTAQPADRQRFRLKLPHLYNFLKNKTLQTPEKGLI